MFFYYIEQDDEFYRAALKEEDVADLAEEGLRINSSTIFFKAELNLDVA